MAEEEPPVIRITDHTGGYGRNWSEQRKGRILMGVAIVLVVGVVVLGAFTRGPAPQAGPTLRPPTVPTSARPIEASRRDLGRFEDEVRDKAAAAPRETPKPLVAPSGPRAPSDPQAADRAKRRYDSLLSSPVVLSRRAPSEAPATATADGRRTPAPRRTESASPTLEETVDAVVRASQRAGLAAPAGPLGAPAAPTVAGLTGGRRVTERTPPIDAKGPMHTLLEGTLIDAVLRIRLENSSNSPVKVMVTHDIYSHDGGVVLLPAGSELIGETQRSQSYGQNRAGVTFRRLIFPDGRTEPLQSALGLNQAGDAGLKDQVNRHLASTIGISAAVGAVTGLGQMVSGIGRAGDHSTVVVAGDAANSASQSTQQVLQRELNRPWTITIREGKRVTVWLNEDLLLPEYVKKETVR